MTKNLKFSSIPLIFVYFHFFISHSCHISYLMDSTTHNNGNADGQENVSDSLLDSSEIGDEADLDTMRKRIREMEEEAEKLKQMQLEVEKQMQLPGTPGTRKFLHIFKKYFIIVYLFSTISNT
jgi:hypothetical protein